MGKVPREVGDLSFIFQEGPGLSADKLVQPRAPRGLRRTLRRHCGAASSSPTSFFDGAAGAVASWLKPEAAATTGSAASSVSALQGPLGSLEDVAPLATVGRAGLRRAAAASAAAAFLATDGFTSAGGKCRRGPQSVLLVEGERGTCSSSLWGCQGSRGGRGASGHEAFIFVGEAGRRGRSTSFSLDSAAPTQSTMICGFLSALRVSFRGREDLELEDAPEHGWAKVVPRCLKVFLSMDVICAIMVAATHNYICEYPLRKWLIGGIWLGFPMSAKVALARWLLKPRYRQYRLQIRKCREAINASDFELNEVRFFGEDGQNLMEYVGKQDKRDGEYWYIECGMPIVVAGYQVVTGLTSQPRNDPVSWIMECSNNGYSWKLVDEVDFQQMPTQRNTPCRLLEELFTMNENAAFRQAFLAELLANAVSFAWLVAGTAWVSQSSESCIDSAPPLWWFCFTLVVLAWSVLGTVTIGLIVSAVAMIMLGVKSPQ